MESRWLFTLRVNRVPTVLRVSRVPTVLRFSLIPCSEDLRKVHCSPCPPSNYTKDRKTGNLTLLETGRGSGLGGTELRSGQGKGRDENRSISGKLMSRHRLLHSDLGVSLSIWMRSQKSTEIWRNPQRSRQRPNTDRMKRAIWQRARTQENFKGSRKDPIRTGHLKK